MFCGKALQCCLSLELWRVTDTHRIPSRFAMDMLDAVLLVKDTPLPSGKKSEAFKSAFSSRSDDAKFNQKKKVV